MTPSSLIYNNYRTINLHPGMETEIDINLPQSPESGIVYFNIHEQLAQKSVRIKDVANKLILINTSQSNIITIKKKEPLAELRLVKTICPDLLLFLSLKENIDKNQRGNGGFGSTGI